MESVSEHPVGKAFAQFNSEPLPIEEAAIVSGKGVEAWYKGEVYRIGSLRFAQGLCDKPLPETLKQEQGTFVYLASKDAWLASFALQDSIREEAAEAIAELKKAGIKTTILSGDAELAVNQVTQSLGIDQGLGELLPDQKLEKLTAFQQQGDIVAMIGDGVNDAPVLAKAQVSLAMGRGSQLAQASADMVLLSENLKHLPESILITRDMQKIVKQNFSWAIGYNLLAISFSSSWFYCTLDGSYWNVR